jgi:hypothetical protein
LWRICDRWWNPCCPLEFAPCFPISPAAILLALANAGTLPRMQSFDWQIVHGIRISGGDGIGQLLDVMA